MHVSYKDCLLVLSGNALFVILEGLILGYETHFLKLIWVAVNMLI